MKRLVKLAALVAAFAMPSMASAQDKVETTLQADVVSAYVWRGMDMGSASIQPTLGIGYKGLSLSAWGAYGFVDKDDIKELDFTLSYSVGGFNVGITDYYCVSGAENAPYKYFDYDGHHIVEGNVGYDFKVLSLNWYTNFVNDKDYSSYFEIAVPFKLGIDWSFTAGFVPYKSSAAYKVNKFACTNLTLKASKDIKVTDSFSIPVFGQLTANPHSGKFYYAFGFSLGI